MGGFTGVDWMNSCANGFSLVQTGGAYHADAWMRHLAHQDKSSTHKSNCQKAVKMLLK